MKFFKLMAFLIPLYLTACKPQTESRIHMDETALRMSDSIKNLLDSCFALPSKALAGTGSPIASSASSFTPK